MPFFLLSPFIHFKRILCHIYIFIENGQPEGDEESRHWGTKMNGEIHINL